jgi:hypothetical protein
MRGARLWSWPDPSEPARSVQSLTRSPPDGLLKRL